MGIIHPLHQNSCTTDCCSKYCTFLGRRHSISVWKFPIHGSFCRLLLSRFLVHYVSRKHEAIVELVILSVARAGVVEKLAKSSEIFTVIADFRHASSPMDSFMVALC